jgi:predicted ester cyclase
MTVEDNKAIVRRFYKAFEENDLEALEDVLAPDLVAYNLNRQNRDEHIQGVRGWNNIFSENRYEIISQIGEDDMVASYVILHSIHNKANFQGVNPTGKQITIGAITMERIQNGKIVERRVYSDRLGMLQQLGVIPPPPTKG